MPMPLPLRVQGLRPRLSPPPFDTQRRLLWAAAGGKQRTERKTRCEELSWAGSTPPRRQSEETARKTAPHRTESSPTPPSATSRSQQPAQCLWLSSPARYKVAACEREQMSPFRPQCAPVAARTTAATRIRIQAFLCRNRYPQHSLQNRSSAHRSTNTAWTCHAKSSRIPEISQFVSLSNAVLAAAAARVLAITASARWRDDFCEEDGAQLPGTEDRTT